MSINENLASWLIDNEGFQETYVPMLIDSCSFQFGKNFISQVSLDQKHDWQYLLYCASLLANSSIKEAREISLRIVHTAVCSDKTSDVEKDCAAIILERLANYPSIKLAEDRGFIKENIEDRLPVYNLLKWTNQRIEHQVYLQTGEVLFANTFQKNFWEKIPSYQITSISAPTSAGKSYILKQWIADQTKEQECACNIVFIVPTRALISEVERDFRDILKGQGKKVNISSSPLPSSIKSDKVNILVFTQERLQIFLNQTEVAPKIDILVIDEAHKIGDGYRGVLLQHVLEKIIDESGISKVIFLSPLTENPEVLLQDYIEQFDTAVLKTQENTVNQNLFWCSQVYGLPKKWELLLCDSGKQTSLGFLGLESKPSSLSKRLSLIAYTIGKDSKGNIVYVDGAAVAEKTALQIYEFIEDSSDGEDQEIKELISLTKQQIHNSYLLCKTLERGVAFHYGNMPDIIRMEIERLFSNGKIKFLICTSTLIEGVNTSCRNIFIRNPKKGRGRPMNKDDFWNLAGRAGRWGKEFQGNVFCIDPNDWEEDAPKYRTEFKIYRSTDQALTTEDDLLAYIEGTYEGKRKRILEYVFSYIYCQYKIKGSLHNTDWAKRFNEDMIDKLDNVLLGVDQEIKVPFEIISRNPGISPIYIDNLFDYFSDGVSKRKKTFEYFIPPTPEDRDAVNIYAVLLQRIAKVFDIKNEIAFNSSHAWSNAIVVVGWMRGHQLSRVISSRIKHQKEKNKVSKLAPQKISSLIREVMERVETIARFYSPKYLACYTDVLEYFLRENEQHEYAENLADYGLLLEYGVSTETQVSLISLGLGRATALALSEFIKGDTWSQDQCIEWLKERDFGDYNLSSVMQREVETILSFLGENEAIAS